LSTIIPWSETVCGLLEISFPECVILEAGALSEAIEALEAAGEVDMVLLDLNIPDVSRFSGLNRLRDGSRAFRS
jgi:CheY-like chemotaxis protein